MATAATAENKIKDLLLGQDVAGQVELLLNLLSDAAAGKELSNVLSEVIQVTIAGGVGHPAVKKLAYDLCKAVPLASSDYSLLVDGIKNDISCGVPEGQVLALRFLPHLPADYLIQLLEKGEIANFVAPHTRNVVPSVRCAATSALAEVLLVPGVQAVMGASADTAASCSDWWDAVVDSVWDSLPDVVVAGLAGANALYQAAAAAAAASSSGGGGGSNAACVAAAQRATLRLAAGIGPLMDTWRMLPSNAQVPVIQLLGHVWTTLLDTDSSSVAAVPAAAGGGFGGSSSTAAAGVDELPAAALPGMLAYLSGALSSLNPAVKLEAARVILRASRLARRGPAGGSSSSSNSSSSSGGQPLSRLRLVGEVPPSTAAAAIEALLELKGRLLVEAALEEVVSLVAAHLEVLQVPTRLLVLGRLWPMIALLQSPTDRLTAFAHAWQAALALALNSAAAAAQGQDPPGGTAATLSGILSDPFLEDIIAEKSPTHSGPFGAAGGASSGTAAAAAAGGPAAAGATGGSLAGAAAGPTGGSVMSGGGGDDVFSDGGSSFPGGSVVTKSRSKRMMASAKGLVTSGAALAGNMGSSLAAAASATLTNLPRLLWDTPPPAKAQLPATLKQELVCTLLSVLSQHPAAAAALQLPPGKPVPPPAPSPAAAAAAAAAGSSSRPLSRLQNGQPQQQQQQQQGAAAAASPTAAAAAAVPNGDVPAAAAGLLPPPPADGAAAADGVVAAAAAQSPQQQQQQQQQARPQFGLDDVSTSPIVASLQSQVVMWLGAAVSALAATRACLQWEPLVVPPMPGQPPTPPLPPMASVNLTTVPVDSWLQLLQAACHAVRSVTRLHGYYSLKAIYRSNGGRMLPQLSPWDLNGALARTCEAAGAALQQLLTRELAEWKGLALAVRPRVLWVAAHYLELPSLLDDTWSVLLGCVEDAVCRGDKQEGDGRTRQLAASARDGLLLKRFAAPQLNMGRDKAGAHTSFDAAAASALVEMHEYKSDALQVGLTVLQYLVWVVQAAIAATQGGTGPAEVARKLLELVRAAALSDAAGVDVRDWCKRMAHTLGAILDPLGSGSSHTAAGAAAAAAGGPAFAILPPAAAVLGPGAKAAHLPGGYNAVAGFSALGFGGGSSSDEGSEDEGEVRRMTREQRLARKLGLGGRKKGGRRTAAAAGGSSSSSSDEDAAAGGSSSSSSSSSGSSSDGSSAAAGDDLSSGDESSSPAGHAAGGSDSDGDEAGAAAIGTNPFSAGGAAAAAAAATAAAAAGDGSRRRGRKHTEPSKSAAKAAKKAARAAKKAAVARAKADSVAVGAAESASGVWGYPFGGPRSQTLFISRRSRRHRLFKWHLALAMANLHDADLAGGLGGGGGAAAAAAAAVRSGGYGGGFSGGLFGTAAGSSGGGSNGGGSGGTMAAAGLTDATGPVFSGESGFRLDQPGFWNSLHGIESGWVDLSGPADPLVLSGRYSTTAGAGSAGGSITVTLRAFNRLPLDLEGVEVLLRLVGPVKAERRETSWNLPPLMPTEAAQHTFSLTPTGYGRLEVHARLLLPLPQLPSEMAVSGAPSLACQPLVVDMARLLRPPECPPPNAQEVLALWSSLPVQVELSATALWPGVDGLLLLLSALARQPMYCAWCHMLPVVCGAQAAFVANPTSHTADSIVVMMVAQLMPDQAAAAEAAAAAAAAAEAAAAAAAAATAAAAASAAAAAAAGDAASDTAEEVLPGPPGMGGGQQQQDKQTAPEGAAAAGADSGGAAQPMPMRCVVQLVVRSSSHEVLLAIQQQPEAWVEDISQGTLCCGVSSRLTPLPHQGKPLLHPLVARLEQQLSSAALLGPPPAPVPPLELPLPPRFRRKLAAKADEEDSDAEDTELELTAEERAEQARALDRHQDACEKAEEKHAAAKASRAAALLRASALAEWRRTACPPLFMG